MLCNRLTERRRSLRIHSPDFYSTRPTAIPLTLKSRYVPVQELKLHRYGTYGVQRIFFVPETYILHVKDSCRFLNCSVSISIFCHVVCPSWPKHMAEKEGGGLSCVGTLSLCMFVLSSLTGIDNWHWQTERHLVEDLWTRNCLRHPPTPVPNWFSVEGANR